MFKKYTCIIWKPALVLASVIFIVFTTSCSKTIEEGYGENLEKEYCEQFVSFVVEPEEYDVATKSRLTTSGIETLKTDVYLAAYLDGTLYTKKYFSTANGDNLSAMTLTLERGKSYTIFALVNFNGNEMFTNDISSLSTAKIECPTYSVMNTNGIPMAGLTSLNALAGNASGTIAIPVKRLFAKVNLNVTCNLSGSVITNARINNLTRLLTPFGDCARTSEQDPLDEYFYEVALMSSQNNSSTLNAVFYIPENLQGDMFAGAPISALKTFDALTSGEMNRLTYLQVDMTADGNLYSGYRTYRSVLGCDELENCDIIRNCVYNWNLTLDEDGFSDNQWKNEPDGWSDNRILSNKQIFVEPYTSVSYSNLFTTNLPNSSINFTLSVPSGQSFTLSEAATSQTSTGFVTGLVNRTTVEVTATPKKNDYGKSTTSQVNIVYRQVGFDQLVYLVDPGSSVITNIKYGYYWPSSNGNDLIWYPIFGKGSGSSKEWEYTTAPGTGITSSYSAGSTDYDHVTYTVAKTVRPGVYPIEVHRTSSAPVPSGQEAVLKVNDTRYLRWTDKSSSYNSDEYTYTENDIHLYYSHGSSRTISGGFIDYNATMFTLGDVTGSGKLYNTTVNSSNYTSYLDLDYDSEYFTIYSFSNTRLMLRCAQNLPIGEHVVTMSIKDSGHSISVHVHVEPAVTVRPRYEFEYGSYEISVGQSSSTIVRVIKHFDRYLEDELIEADVQSTSTMSRSTGTYSVDDYNIASITSGSSTGGSLIGYKYGNTVVRWTYNDSTIGTVNLEAPLTVHQTYTVDRYLVADVTYIVQNNATVPINSIINGALSNEGSTFFINSIMYPVTQSEFDLIVVKVTDTYYDGTVQSLGTTGTLMQADSSTGYWRVYYSGSGYVSLPTSDSFYGDFSYEWFRFTTAGSNMIYWGNKTYGSEGYIGTDLILVTINDQNIVIDNPGRDDDPNNVDFD